MSQSVNTAYLCLSNGDIVLADLSSCSSNVVASFSTSMLDISQGDTDDTLYGIKNEDLYRIDLITGNFTLLGQLNVIGFTGNFRVTSLVRESAGLLLGVNQSSNGELFRINVTALTATKLGNTGYESAGDLTYFNGALYLSGEGDELVLVDVQNPPNSSFVGSLASTGIDNIFGVVTIIIADPCAASPTYALVATGSRTTSFVNPLNGNTTPNCTNFVSDPIYGAAEVNSDVICSIDIEIEGDGVASPSFCGSGSPALTTIVDPVSSIGSYTYEWREQGSATILSGNATYTPTVNTTTIFECTVTDSGRAAPDNTAINQIQIIVNLEPVWTPIDSIIAFSWYDLPTINATNIPANAAYFTEPGGIGTRYTEGDQITVAAFSTNPTIMYVYGIDQNGCELQGQFTIDFVNVQVTINPLGPLSGCEGDQITLTATPAPASAYGSYTYNWDDGLGGSLPSTPSITATLTQSTTFSVTVNDSGIENGSGMGFDRVTLDVTPTIVIDDLADQSAQNTFTFPSITGTNLSSGVRYYTQSGGLGFSYTPGDVVDVSNFISLPVTIYMYDVNGACNDEESFVLDIIPTNFNLNLTSTASSVCPGESVTLAVIPDPITAVGNYSYEWSTSTDPMVLSTGDSLSAAVNNNTVFLCTVIDDGITGTAATVQETIRITVNPAITINAISNVTVNNSFLLPVITGTGLTGIEAYFTAPDGGGTRYEAGDRVDASDFASFPVILYIYCDNGFCTDTQNFELIIDPVIISLTVTASTIDICEGTSITLSASVTPATPINTYGYQWTSSVTGAVVGTSATISVTPSATTIFTCSVTDDGILGTVNNASNSVTVQVTPRINLETPADQTVNIEYTFPSITGGNISSTAAYFTGPDGTGTPYNPGDVVNATDFTSLPVRIYVFDSNGPCEEETSFLLDIITPDLFLDISTGNLSICTGEETTLAALPDPFTALGSYTFEWSVIGSSTIIGTGRSINVTPVTDTVYECTVTDSGLPAGLNQSRDSIAIEVSNTPAIDQLINQNVEGAFVFSPITGSNLSGSQRYYLEANGQGSFFIAGDMLEFSETQRYPIEVFIYDMSSNGCQDETSFSLTITTPFIELFDIPQFFTPNDDTYHDTWNVIIMNSEVIMERIFIYDRYGKLIKQIAVTGAGWNGEFNSNPLPSSSYWYQFSYEFRGVISERSGYFALKR